MFYEFTELMRAEGEFNNHLLLQRDDGKCCIITHDLTRQQVSVGQSASGKIVAPATNDGVRYVAKWRTEAQARSDWRYYRGLGAA